MSSSAKRHPRKTRALYYLATLAALLLIWQCLANAVQADYLPGPVKVLPRLVELMSEATLWSALASSLLRLAISFILALAGGVALGLAIGRIPVLRALVDPILSLSYPIPKAAILPIVMLWFGAGDVSQIFVIATTATLPVIYHTADGASRVNEQLLWASASMGSKPLTRLWRIVLPATLPEIAAGSRTAIVMGLIVMVTAEMISRTNGIGSLLFVHFDMGQNTDMYALILLLGIVGLALDNLLDWPFRRLTQWTTKR
ncbi:MAG TPA: ABC transporter permease [Eoetvoesiella sp.]|uniref:ABC transporter permease n=1 Tax=Eoetvoesiella sp. TaxID=1966355 RepID=UPI002D0931CE|nr:ABC transporter permease [Eoetvoesiella sp.]HWK61220.1 ABC transporter permease [Eoetvoesiella sp.]